MSLYVIQMPTPFYVRYDDTVETVSPDEKAVIGDPAASVGHAMNGRRASAPRSIDELPA
ncbi:hypothetical protein tb265_06220 [Gemmatimonadetes bacterium T265]|nr:hypothetical protein tb265_06220 [Gemmatimonadetes bacterium T265]